ncbi:hypothetical protein TRVL_07023 [Trypanosoma vivax]|nr:hypothetical protein TRVL_07023 [Trypanosoma vivax]
MRKTVLERVRKTERGGLKEAGTVLETKCLEKKDPKSRPKEVAPRKRKRTKTEPEGWRARDVCRALCWYTFMYRERHKEVEWNERTKPIENSPYLQKVNIQMFGKLAKQNNQKHANHTCKQGEQVIWDGKCS